MTIGQSLRKRRLELGMTQEQVARDAGMNVTQYNGYERERSAPSDVTLPRIAAALQATPEVLLGRSTGLNDVGEPRGKLLRRLHHEFRSQVAAELNLEPEDVTVRIEIL